MLRALKRFLGPGQLRRKSMIPMRKGGGPIASTPQIAKEMRLEPTIESFLLAYFTIDKGY